MIQYLLPSFFSDSYKTRPSTRMLKYFWMQFLFRSAICMCKKLCSVIYTSESISAVSLTPWSQTQRYQWLRVEPDSALSLTLWSQTQRYQWLHGARLSGINGTIESISRKVPHRFSHNSSSFEIRDDAFLSHQTLENFFVFKFCIIWICYEQ